MPRAEPVSNVAQVFGTKLLEYILGKKKKKRLQLQKACEELLEKFPQEV